VGAAFRVDAAAVFAAFFFVVFVLFLATALRLAAAPPFVRAFDFAAGVAPDRFARALAAFFFRAADAFARFADEAALPALLRPRGRAFGARDLTAVDRVLVRVRAGRLAMVGVLWSSLLNLDSLSISGVLSDAYRKSEGAAEHPLTEIAGGRFPPSECRHSRVGLAPRVSPSSEQRST
jgi:hypothetical protein